MGPDTDRWSGGIMTAENGKVLPSQTPDSEWYRKRTFLTVCCILPVFAALAIRLFFLQVVEGENFRRLSENNCIRLQTIDSPRGLVFDRNGILLVDNRPSYDVGLVVRDAKPLEGTVRNLSDCLMVPEYEILETIRNNRHYSPYKPVLIKPNIGRNTLAYLEANRYSLPGIVVDVRLRRQYIHPGQAAHLLGYMGEINPDELKAEGFSTYRPGDIVGKFGVEKSYELILNGKRGGRQVEVNSTGRLVNILNTVPAEPGHNIYLSIDSRLQARTETLLGDSAGAVVAMDPNTGHVLAMASNPSFDQNLFIQGLTQGQWEELANNPFRPMENKAIQAEYPPASTYKIITAIAGLEEGVVDEKTTFFCAGHMNFGGREYRCWKKGGHGTVNLTRAMAESCDVYFYQVGLKLGVDRLASYAKAFGLGSQTGVQLDSEARGLVPTSGWKKKKTGVSWQAGETLSVSIGQGYNLATPLQMAVVTSAIANGGYLLTPIIVSRMENAAGETIEIAEPIRRGRIPLKSKHLELVQKGMLEVVNGNDGTARNARLERWQVCGKTGTAQVFSRKSNEAERTEKRARHLRSHAWFVAYAPYEEPRIAVSVIVEHGEHGSSAAAPIASELIQTYLSFPSSPSS